MKNFTKALFAVGIFASLCSCNPGVYTSVTSVHEQVKPAAEIQVLYVGSEIPENAEKIGSVQVEETGFTTNCSYDVVVAYAQDAAAFHGADLLLITEHKAPNFWSSCHQIWADFYKFSDTKEKLNLPVDSGYSDYYQGDYTEERSPVVIGETETQNPPAQPVQPAPEYDPSRVAPAEKGKALRIAASGGYAFRLAPVADLGDEFIEDYLRELKSGTFISFELGVKVDPQFSIGMRYDRMRSSNSAFITTIPEDPNEPSQSGIMSDDVRIIFIAPQMYWHNLSKDEKFEFLLGVSIGYMGLRNEAEFLTEEIEITGATLGLRTDLAFDFRVHPNIALGINLGLATGGLSRIEVQDATGTNTIEFEAGEGESLARFDIGGGIRFVF